MEEINTRQKMINNLSIFINFVQNETHQVLLLIDANKSIHSNSGGITTLIDKTKLIDPITNMHGATDEPNTHKRGTTRIDFILCTMGISSFITRSGILSFDFITTTDHQVLYIDIQLKLYLQDPLHTINDMSYRLLSTSNPKGVIAYKKHLLKHSQKNHTTTRVNNIQKEIDLNYLKDKELKTIHIIDHELTSGVLQAEQRIKNTNHPIHGHQLWYPLSCKYK